MSPRRYKKWCEIYVLRSVLVASVGIACSVACSSRQPSTAIANGRDSGSETTASGPGVATETREDSGVSDTEASSGDATRGETGTESVPTGASAASTSMTDAGVGGTASTNGGDVVTASSDASSETMDDAAAAQGEAIPPPEGMIVVSSFDADDPAGYRDGSSNWNTTAVERADSIGTLVVPFTAGGFQQSGWAFSLAGDYCGYELVARVKLVSGFNQSATSSGAVQLRVWSDDFAGFSGGWQPLSGVGTGNKLGQWVEYRLDLDNAPAVDGAGPFDPTNLNAVGVTFFSGSDASAVYTTATFDIDWLGLVEKPGGCAANSDNDGGVVGGETDASVRGANAIDPPADMVVISNFDNGDDLGFASGDSRAETLTTSDSLATLTIPFTGGNYQQGVWAFGVDGNYCGYEVVTRLKLLSGFNASPSEAGGVQFWLWSGDDWGTAVFQGGAWNSLSAVGSSSALGEWVEYRFDLDQAALENPNFNPSNMHAVGLAIQSGGSASAVYTTAQFEWDWVGLVPKAEGCTSDMDGGVGTEPGVSDASADAGPAPIQAIDPPSDMVVISSFNNGDNLGFASGDSRAETLTTSDSLATLTIPFDGGNYQQGVWAFGFDGNYCGYEIVTRLKLVSGFNADPGEAGGVQFWLWSGDDWGTAVYQAGSWSNLSAVGSSSALGEWVEYRFDLDQAALDNPNFDPSNMHAAGVAIQSGGPVQAVYTTAVFEWDWVGVVPKPGGCAISGDGGT